MPYKDPERKKEWERLHRSERLARRRDLRRIEAARAETPRQVPKLEAGDSALLIPAIAGGAPVVHSPRVGIAVGGLTLVSAAVFKKKAGPGGWWGASPFWWHCCSIGEIARVRRLQQRKQRSKGGSGLRYDLKRFFKDSSTSF